MAYSGYAQRTCIVYRNLYIFSLEKNEIWRTNVYVVLTLFAAYADVIMWLVWVSYKFARWRHIASVKFTLLRLNDELTSKSPYIRLFRHKAESTKVQIQTG